MSCVPDRIGIWKCWFLRRGENQSTRRKTSRSKGENQQQTQPTYGVDARIRTWATLVGGECSHHCATLAPFCGGLPCIMGLKLALPPMAFTVPYLSLFFELVFHLFFDGTVCSFFFHLFFL